MNKTIKTDLICPECGNILSIHRKESKQKKPFHRKLLYCPICKKNINHIEIKDWDILIETLKRKEESLMTEDEQKVYRLLKKRG